jgi:hypothetical protein
MTCHARSVVAIVFLVTFFSITDAGATTQRTFVASNGNDANPCSLALPCRSFAAALTQTRSGGEVVALDSAGYGPMLINQSVSVIAPSGIYAAITTTSGVPGVDVATAPTDLVVLRGLNIVNVLNSGIRFAGGGHLVVENCQVTNAGYGIEFRASGPARLTIGDTVVRGNNGGIFIEGDATAVTPVVIDHSLIEDSSNGGVAVFEGADVLVRNSQSNGNHTYGFYAQAVVAGTFARLTIENSVAANNMAGIRASGENFGTTTVVVSNSVVSDNATCGLCSDGGIANIESRGNNTVRGNSPDVSGTPIPIGGA